MKYNICSIFLHLLFCTSSLLLLCFKITSATPLDYFVAGAKEAGNGGVNYTCISKERDALLHFKSYIHQDPKGLLSNWTSERQAANNCCYWKGVMCNNHSHVTSLDLSFGGLEGKISPSLLNLSYLKHLDLHINSFYGTIPMFIGLKTKLRYLDLSENSFGGTIPKFIGSMSQLRHLDLGLNDFTGLIPSELGNLTNLHVLSLRNLRECTIENLDWLSHLSQLEDLLMDGTSLAKTDNWVNVILSLHKLSSLSLRECELAGVMHPHFNSSVNSSSSIVSLTLRDNNLNSSMFQWLSPLTSNRLVDLDLSGNKLDGIPKYFRNLCSLSYLYFHDNSMLVKLPDFLNNLSGCTSVTLLTLYASSSQFSGSLSDDIRKFSSLKELDLSHNQLNGTISEKVWKLPNLGYLNLSSNSLKGVISRKIRSSKFITIDLSNNSLDGVSLLPYLSKFSNVEDIILSSNNISYII